MRPLFGAYSTRQPNNAGEGLPLPQVFTNWSYMPDLITLEEYKTAKGIASDKEDGKISAVIPKVSQLVKTYCGNSLVDYYNTNDTEYFNIPWSQELIQLTESPIVDLVSVEERASIGENYTALTETEYYLDTTTECIYRVSDSGNRYTSFALGPGSVRVVYKAGYDGCPADLKLAVIDLVSYYVNSEHKQMKTQGAASVQNQGVSKQNSDFPDHIKRVLDLYRTY